MEPHKDAGGLVPGSVESSPSLQPDAMSYIDSLATHAIDAVLPHPHHPPPHPNPHSRASTFLFSTSTTTNTLPTSYPPHHPHLLPHPDDPVLIAQQYSELMAQNDLLAKENRLFDSFLQRTAEARLDMERSPKHNKRDKNRAQYEPTLSDVSHHHARSPPPPHSQLFLRASHGSSSPLLSPSFHSLPLSPSVYVQLDRNRLAMEELEYRSTQLSALQQKSAEDVGLLKAISLNLSIRMGELKKEAFEFQRQVVTKDNPHGPPPSSSSSSTPTSAEVLLRWQADKLKAKASLISKLQLKLRHQRTVLASLQSALRTKEEQGDSLHSIDFHQLQIKNSQYNGRVKEKNEALLLLKQSTGTAVNRLNQVKRVLQEQLQHNRQLKAEKQSKAELRARMDAEMTRVEEEIAVERARRSRYQQLQANPDMPQVMDYVRQKMDMERLERDKRNLDRKIEIASMVREGRRAKQGSGGGGGRGEEEREGWVGRGTGGTVYFPSIV